MDIADCMAAEEIRIAVLDDKHIVMLSELVLCSWPSTKAEVQKHLQSHRSFRHEIGIIDSIVMKGRRIVILVALQDQALKELQLSHMGIEKTQLLVHMDQQKF